MKKETLFQVVLLGVALALLLVTIFGRPGIELPSDEPQAASKRDKRAPAEAVVGESVEVEPELPPAQATPAWSETRF